jgi:hypothetical protein
LLEAADASRRRLMNAEKAFNGKEGKERKEYLKIEDIC